MIDKIVLFNKEIKIDITKFKDYELTTNNQYNMLHDNCICGHFLNQDKVCGNRYSIRNDYFNLIVKPKQIFLCPQLHTLLDQEHNLLTLNKNNFIEALERLGDMLDSHGIYFDTYKSQLSKIEIRKNLYLDYSYDEYEPLLKALYAKKMKKFNHINSYYFENSLRQIIIYDKTLQLAQKRYNFPNANIMRIEYRMKKKQKVMNDLKYDSVKSLINNWDKLESIYLEKTGDLLFANKKPVMDSHKRSPENQFKWFMNKSDAKYKMNEYLMTKGVEKVMEEVGDISVFSRELSQNAIDSSYQHIKKFQGRLLNSKFSKEYGPTIGELYNEIHSKFYGPHEDYLDGNKSIDATRLVFPLEER